MNDAQQAHENLAFMKALVEEEAPSQTASGAVLFASGMLYGAQCLVQWADAVGILHLPGPIMLAFVILVSLTFFAVLATVMWRNRKVGQRAVSVRALNAAFGGAGIANLVICTVFGLMAWHLRSIEIWLLYPITVCALMGAAWYVAAMMRRRVWLGAVSFGWFVTGIGLGILLALDDKLTYTLVLGLAILGLLGLPGAVMMRQGKRASQ